MIEFLEDVGEMIFGNKRMDALRHFANSKKFAMKRRVKAELLPLDVQYMQVFDGKKAKRIRGFLYKRDLRLNALTQIFDYHYDSNLGTKITTIFLMENKGLNMPYFCINPKSHFSKLGNIFRSGEWSDVDKVFDENFEVVSEDINFMNIMITIQFAEVMTELLGFTVEGKGDYLVLYKKNTKIDIVDMDNVYDAGVELLDIILNDQSNEMV